jgi:hypothetical protein
MAAAITMTRTELRRRVSVVMRTRVQNSNDARDIKVDTELLAMGCANATDTSKGETAKTQNDTACRLRLRWTPAGHEVLNNAVKSARKPAHFTGVASTGPT